MKPKFEYFLNAVHYCIYLHEIREHEFFDKYFGVPFNRMLDFFMSEEKKRRFRLNQQKNKKNVDDFFYSKDFGTCIGWAHHFFGFFSTCYFLFIGFVLLGLLSKLYGVDEVLGDGFVRMLVLGIPIIIGYIPLYKAVFSNDVYLKYFREFEKKDEKWHRKWKWITAAFVILSVVAFFSGVFITFIMVMPVFG
ncbi:MAG: hypothetical protein VZR53_15845 [Prevotella sp.]|nr:hypothetical protein [Prevotella sp.]